MGWSWTALAVTLPLLVSLALLLGIAAWPRRSAALAVVPWVPISAASLLIASPTTLGLEHVLVGSRALLDEPSRWATAVAAVLFLALGLANRRWLAGSPGAAACFLLAWAGVQAQCLAGEQLLYLAGASTAGYAMLALTRAARPEMASWQVAAIAALLLAGDLALLELATLVAEAGPGLSYTEAAATLAGLRGRPLAELCLALGFAGRIAIVGAIVVWSRQPHGAALRLLPGWLAIGLCSMLGRARIADRPPDHDAWLAPWSAELVGALPLLLLALALPGALRRGAAVLEEVGRVAAYIRDRMAGALLPAGRLRSSVRLALDTVEDRLGRWAMATSLLVLFAAGLLLRVLV